MRVQISMATKQALEELNPRLFKTSQRSNVDAVRMNANVIVSFHTAFALQDGKQMKTFWLDGKNGPARDPPPLPIVPDEESQHEDGASTARYTPVSEAEIQNYMSRASSVVA